MITPDNDTLKLGFHTLDEVYHHLVNAKDNIELLYTGGEVSSQLRNQGTVLSQAEVDYIDAIKIIADEQRLDISEFFNYSEKNRVYLDDREKLKRIHKLAQEFFVDNLKKSPKALDYLHENRKLPDNIINDFGI